VAARHTVVVRVCVGRSGGVCLVCVGVETPIEFV